MPPRTVPLRTCDNCDLTLGRLEPFFKYHDNTVCNQCYLRLNRIPKKSGNGNGNGNGKGKGVFFLPCPSSNGHSKTWMGRLTEFFSNDMAIDLGTANTLVYMKGKGIVIDEPSVVAIHINRNGDKKILAVGLEARKMVGRTPENVTAIRPIRDGVIADFDASEAMLRYFIRKAMEYRTLVRFRPKVVIAVPSGITQVERRAVIESAQRAGAKSVFLIEEPMAAAIGADLPISEPICSMVVDIGGGTTEVAVISLAGVVCSRSLRVAGDRMDEAIIAYIKKRYNLIIGEQTAEEIKKAIGDAQPDPNKKLTFDFQGSHIVTGIPKVLTVDYREIREAISDQLNAIVEAVKGILERTPPELAGDIVNRGIVLTGGGALLKNLDKLLEAESGLPFVVSDNPLCTVVLGTGKALGSNGFLKRIMIH